MTLRQLIARLQETYTSSIGYEFMHISHKEMTDWLKNQIETEKPWQFSPEQKKQILQQLLEADYLEVCLCWLSFASSL